jgi:hypothetical protein
MHTPSNDTSPRVGHSSGGSTTTGTWLIFTAAVDSDVNAVTPRPAFSGTATSAAAAGVALSSGKLA